MIYVGRSLPAIGTAGAVPEPALINPDLPYATQDADILGEHLPYWPSYSEIAPSSRLAYLRWLENGKRDPKAAIGYVFLYFYGLERRLLTEEPGQEEREALLAEVRQLRELYAGNRSFDGYTRQLLEAVDVLDAVQEPAKLAHLAPPDLQSDAPSLTRAGKLRLARKIASRAGLTLDEALALYLARHRAPALARRQHELFLDLLRQRFGQAFPDGFTVEISPDTAPLVGEYVGANRFLRMNILEGTAEGHLRDPVEADLGEFNRLFDEVSEELAPFNRLVAREPGRAASVEALLLLPGALQQGRVERALQSAQRWVDERLGDKEFATASIGEVITRALGEEFVPTGTIPVDGRSVAVAAEALARLGCGLEPDPLYTSGRLGPDDPAVVFRLPAGQYERAGPTAAYRKAAAVATLVAGIAAANEGRVGEAEARHLEWVDETTGINEHERRRLRAHVRWLVARGVGFSVFSRLAREIPEDQRDGIARFMATVGAADGVASGPEIAFLEQIYDELDVPRDRLQKHLHELLPQGAKATAALAEVEQREAWPAGSGLPLAPRFEQSIPHAPAGLDPDRLAKTRADTEAVEEVLRRIFVEEMPPEPSVPAEPPPVDELFSGLEARHGRLLEQLLIRSNWPPAEFERLVREVGLMPGGALETINEWAFARLGDAIIEDGDPLTINWELVVDAAPEAWERVEEDS